MSRVLVTGARGFIGRHALPLLAQAGYDVHAVSSHPEPGAGSGARWHVADLLVPGEPTRLAATVKADKLLHLAWYTVPPLYWTSDLNERWFDASVELSRAFQANGGSRIVAAGTSAEYDQSGRNCVETTTALRPTTPYGLSKLKLCSFLEAFGSEFQVGVAWGRVFHLYGPYEHPNRLVSSAILSLLRGEPARCTSGRQVRDYLHVADVAGAFVALVQSDVSGAFNIASGEPVALREILKIIGSRVGRPELLMLDAISARPGEPALLTADISLIQAAIGWRRTIDLNPGLDQTIEWWRTQVHGTQNEQ